MIKTAKGSVLFVFLGAIVWVVLIKVAIDYEAPRWMFELLIAILAGALWYLFHDPGSRRLRPPSS